MGFQAMKEKEYTDVRKEHNARKIIQVHWRKTEVAAGDSVIYFYYLKGRKMQERKSVWSL